MNATLFLRISMVVLSLVASGIAGAEPAADATQFPAAKQVLEDYPDPLQGYAVLTILWEAMPRSTERDDAANKRDSYFNTAQEIRQVATGGNAADFDSRAMALMKNPGFRSLVQAKYHLATLPAEPSTPAADVPKVELGQALLRASPFLVGSILLMILIVNLMLSHTTGSPTAKAARAEAEGLLAMPESLHTVKVPGLEYSVDVLSGRVLDKESPPDSVWVQTLQKQEVSLTFAGGSFQARAGQMISAITRQAAGGALHVLAAYNHSSEQFGVFGAGGAHETASGRRAWLFSALPAAVGFAIALAMFVSIQTSEHAWPVWIYPVLYLMGLVVSAILGRLIVSCAQKRIRRKRERCFEDNYLPRFQEFLERRTVLLEKSMAAARQ